MRMMLQSEINMDPDFYNTLAKEERGQQKEIKERKNQILAMTNTKKKQIEWNKLFPPYQPSPIPY